MLRIMWLGLMLVCAAPASFADEREHHGDRWVEVAPPARAGHVCVYDARQQRLIVFGGHVDGMLRNDVWVLSLSRHPRWDRIESASEAPSPRSGASAAYDAARGRVLLFGGRDTSDQPLDDLWELSLRGRRGRATWKLLAAAGQRPEARYGATLTPDPENGGFILYGGASWPGYQLSDAWTLSPSGLGWRPITPSGTSPRGRYGHTAVYCPDLHGLLVFGGEVPGRTFGEMKEDTDELWLLTLGDHPAWTSQRPPSPGPCGMRGHAAAWDGAGHRLLVYGEGPSRPWRACAVNPAALWSLSVPGLAWSQLAPAQPWPRSRRFAAAFFDPAGRSLYVHGGEGRNGACYADAWRLALDPEPAWTLLAPHQVTPSFLSSSQMPAVYDLPRDRILVDGGDRVWAYDMESAEWSPIVASGSAPPVHLDNSAVLDTRRDRLVVYGGRLRDRIHPFQQVWTLSLGDSPRWTQLPTRDQPPAVSLACGIYDPVRDRLLVHASMIDGYHGRGLWALPFGTAGVPGWLQISPPPGPVALPPLAQLAVEAYDSMRDRMVSFSGGHYDDGWNSGNGCWALTLNGPPVWDELSPNQLSYNRDPALPGPRILASGVYDSGRDRLIIVGGRVSGMYSRTPDDAWALAFDSNRWARLGVETNPHPGWLDATAVYDSRRNRTLVLQGDVMWALESNRDARRNPPREDALQRHGPNPGASVLELGGVFPNPSAGEMMVQFTLPDAEPATLELLDLAGRRLWMQDVGRRGGGPHAIQVRPARAVAPGLYLLRLTRGTASFTRKVIRLGE